jgi:hypothetical protein
MGRHKNSALNGVGDPVISTARKLLVNSIFDTVTCLGDRHAGLDW